MDIVKMGDIAVVKTNREFMMVLGESIHGPFPCTKKMVDSLLVLIDAPDSEEAIQSCVTALQQGRIKNKRHF